jgi:DNA-3-methyladenine glycosylase II
VSPTNDPAAIAAALRKYKPLRPVIDQVGPPPIQRRQPTAARYPFLVRSIVFQQLASRAASAIHGRLCEGCGGTVSASAIDALSDKKMTGFGLSATKRSAIRDLTAHVDAGQVRLNRHGRLADDAIIDELVQVRGIGPWTAQMYLMFCLGRTDVWPTGDFGVRNGWSIIHGLDPMITAKDLEPAGAPLSPHRSAVASYCWSAVDLFRNPTS